ncbi:hypothetical protein ACHAWC_002464 [Mediolabrus comicus]
MRQSLPSIVTLSEIEEIVSTDSFALQLIDAIKNGFVSYSAGGFNACPIQTMGAPPMAPFSGSCSGSGSGGGNYQAQTCVKSGYVTGASHYVIKVASGGHPFPSNSGLMQLYSQSTGKLETILLDEGILTELRTAAVGALAAQLLAPPLDEITCIGILGTGIQARYQLKYLAHVTSCRTVKVWGRTKENVQKYINDMKLDGWTITAVDTHVSIMLFIFSVFCLCISFHVSFHVSFLHHLAKLKYPILAITPHLPCLVLMV